MLELYNLNLFKRSEVINPNFTRHIHRYHHWQILWANNPNNWAVAIINDNIWFFQSQISKNNFIIKGIADQ